MKGACSVSVVIGDTSNIKTCKDWDSLKSIPIGTYTAGLDDEVSIVKLRDYGVKFESGDLKFRIVPKKTFALSPVMNKPLGSGDCGCASAAKVLNEEKPSPKLRKFDIIAEGQRSYVISMVTSLAEEANGFRDQTLRVRVQAGAADALWETDSELARSWFRRAWATAEKFDRESERAADEARRRFLTSRQSLAFIYVKAARAATLKGDGRTREFADRIENIDLRKRARLFVDFVAVRKSLDAKDVEGSLRIIRGGELQPLQRVWAYSELARILKQSDTSRAIQLLNDANTEVRNISNGELERVYALSCVASQFYMFDRARTWEVADDVVKASNAIADSTADNGKLTVQLQVRDVVAMVNLEVPAFNLTNLFELLAKDDFQRATSLANTFKGEAPRATANLAVARSLLKRQRGK